MFLNRTFFYKEKGGITSLGSREGVVENMASLNSFLPACAMARVRWLGLFLLLLHVLPSLSDFASWERRRELDKKREKIWEAREDKERTEERISQAEAKLASLPPWTTTCGQCLPFPNNATGLKVLAS